MLHKPLYKSLYKAVGKPAWLSTGSVDPILALFANGEQGGFLDLATVSTRYTSVTSYSLATASDPIGAIAGVENGQSSPELYSGGDIIGDNQFSSLTSYGTGVMLEVGASYLIEFTVANFSGSSTLGILNGSTTWSSLSSGDYRSDANTTISVIAAYASTTEEIEFFTRDSNNADFRDISIRKLPGIVAWQNTAGERPTLKSSPIWYADFDGSNDELMVTVPDLGTDATVAYLTTGGTVTYLETQTVGAGNYTLPTTDWGKLVLIDRALTADEKTSIEGQWT